MEEPSQLLRNLLEFKLPLESTINSLAAYPFDYGGPCLPIERKHFRHAISLYLEDKVSEDELEEWANELEPREDLINYDTDDIVIHDTLFDLANPYLQGKISKKSCLALLIKLG